MYDFYTYQVLVIPTFFGGKYWPDILFIDITDRLTWVHTDVSGRLWSWLHNDWQNQHTNRSGYPTTKIKKSMVTTTRAARRKPGQIVGVTDKCNAPFAATAVKSNKWYEVSVPVAGGYLAKKEYYCLGNYRLKQQQQQQELRLWRRSKRLFMICFLLFSSPVCLSVCPFACLTYVHSID